jgi:Tetracyclin repressor-like, C-terminal domain
MTTRWISCCGLGEVANWVRRWYDPAGDADSDEMATTFADFLVGGLLARP